MPVVISMLRGINVGGHNTVKMDELRAVYESLGLRDVQTYIQSGNIVFRTPERDLERLTRRVEKGIERSFGFRPGVLVRTTSELNDVIARNPFANRAGVDPRKLLVTFLASDPGHEARDRILTLKADPEELWVDGRELYVYYPNGVGMSKFSPALIERTLKTPGTGRNWNTVGKLLDMALRLER